MSTLAKIGRSFEKNPLPWTIGAVAVGVGAFFLIKKLGGGLKTGAQNLADESRFRSSGQTLSYPLSSYTGYADAIYEAGMVWNGTDENAIYNVFKKMNNDLDVLQLIKAFGMRRKEWSLQEANLGGYISSEFDSDELAELNKLLAAKGITYRF